MTPVFQAPTDEATLDFSTTVVPMRLVLHEGGHLVSRAQAKRIMNRVERFRNVMLDFAGVESVGRSFVDEIFRVFARNHPAVTVKPINMTAAVEKEVMRVARPNDGV